MEMVLARCTKEVRRGTVLRWDGRTQLSLQVQRVSLGLDLAVGDLAGVMVLGLRWATEVSMDQDLWEEPTEVIMDKDRWEEATEVLA